MFYYNVQSCTPGHYDPWDWHDRLVSDVASTMPGRLELPAMQVSITAGWAAGTQKIASLYLDSNQWSLAW